MKLSTRSEYGLRAMVDLAMRHGEGPVSLRSIAERQDISEHYLEQLMSSLRKAGLITSSRGAQGGYELARPPKETSVGDIVRVLEGPIAPLECADETLATVGGCDKKERCVSRIVWCRLRDSIAQVLDSTTLEDLCLEARKLDNRGDSFMYYI